ncbi:ThuA domain-containing protein [Kutzneria chonburiensis]|uniref:ThuA domain-containing protein n=1 Tax=Kutzneria chonburiensis TaxID=1483604 RepID=A0ABV6MNV4_9PSEU|nr:ThuA domain-containing protein [Kutzneria chonburiensis]
MTQLLRAILALLALLPGIVIAPQPHPFTVLAFYTGRPDAAHIAFDNEAAIWFPQAASRYGFSYRQTNDWTQLVDLTKARADVVMFLDDIPTDPAQRAGFQHYVEHGGAYFGFHYSGYNDEDVTWPWFNNTFMGAGKYADNTWSPTTAVLHTDARHPATRRLPTTWTAAVSEWYSWEFDLRKNPDIEVLASVDASSFPVGTDPAQSWYSGYYPILWTNKRYKMLYANFGHNAMNYSANTPLSSTFADPVQDKFIIDGLLWLGGAAPTNASADQIDPNARMRVTNQGSCLDGSTAVARTATCESAAAQRFRFRWLDGPYLRIDNGDRSLGTDGGLARFTGADNQKWQAVFEAGGAWHIVSKVGQKCLTAGAGPLTLATCTGAATQSFTLTRT